MTNTPRSQQTLCIDLKKCRLRIHLKTLHLMGDPDYIQLLVNPEENMLAIKKSISKDHLSHRVKWNARKEGTCFELYSRDLVHRLCLCNPVWQRNRSYRIYGNINAKEGLAFFRMGNCIPVNEEKE